MELILYMIIRGFGIGMLISAPMGPVGILCIQRTLNKGRWAGFCTGIGAAVSDLFYCLLTGLGMSFVIDFIEANQNLLQVFGSLVLVLFALHLYYSNPANTLKSPKKGKMSFYQESLTGFLFTVSNPLIIFFIIALYARFNFLTPPDLHFVHYLLGFVSIIVGALTWWFIVTYFVNKVRSHFNVRSMWRLNRIIGIIIFVMSVFGLFMGIKDYLLQQ